MRRRLGASQLDLSGQLAPLGKDPNDLSLDALGGKTLDYRDVAFIVRRGRVAGFVVTAGDAETLSGVGVGDSLYVARRKYSGIECADFHYNDSSAPAFPCCRARLTGRAVIWFGGDPIDNITVREAPGMELPRLRRAASP